MIEDASNDLGSHALSLIRPVDDHIPDRCAIDEVGEDSTEPDEATSIPGTERQIGMAEHFLRVIERTILGPWGLVEQPKKLRCVRGIAMGVDDDGLEGWRHLILEYPPSNLRKHSVEARRRTFSASGNSFGVYGENDVNASP